MKCSFNQPKCKLCELCQFYDLVNHIHFTCGNKCLQKSFFWGFLLFIEWYISWFCYLKNLNLQVVDKRLLSFLFNVKWLQMYTSHFRRIRPAQASEKHCSFRILFCALTSTHSDEEIWMHVGVNHAVCIQIVWELFKRKLERLQLLFVVILIPLSFSHSSELTVGVLVT